MRLAAPTRRLLGGGLVQLAVTLLVLDAVALASWGTPASTFDVLREFSFAGVWLVVGLVASRGGRWHMQRASLVLAAVAATTVPTSVGLLSQEPMAVWMVTLGALLVPWQTPVLGRLILTFPTGRLDTQGLRILLVLACGLAAVESLLVLRTGLPYYPRRCDGCAPGLSLGESAAIATTVGRFVAVGWVVLVVVALWMAAQRYRHASARRRSVLKGHYVVTLLALVSALTVSAYAALSGSGLFSHESVLLAAQAIVLLGVPLSLFVGLIRDLSTRTRLAEMVQESTSAGLDLQTSLAQALRDPDLAILARTEDGWVDRQGASVDLEAVTGDRVVTRLYDNGGTLLAAVVHDASLEEEPRLLMAAGSAVRVALEYDVMQTLVARQTHELRASRARVVQATDHARRRVERDLHDGAQQYLVAAGLALQLGRGMEAEESRKHADEAASLIQAALQSLRDLAHGLYPASLVERGLESAVRAMAGRLPLPVEISGEIPDDLPPEVRDALFFSISEAVANTLKHAEATAVRLDFAQPMSGRVIVVEVHDNGRGGVPAEANALASIADRVASVDGRLQVDSPRGVGTCVRIEVPCAR